VPQQGNTASKHVADQAESDAIGPLGKHHDRAAFSCGVDTLDKYLRERAGHDARKNLTRVFVANGTKPHVISGYYTLSSYGIDVGEMPEADKKKLPRYPIIPSALIGRLAVAVSHQGTGLGERLLLDALARVVEVSEEVASYAIVVEAMDERAISYYRKYGFFPFPSQPLRLFLPTATANIAILGK